METEKLASNFELNFLQLGKNRIQLVKGDRFTSNGHTFDYKPSTAENKGKGKQDRWSGRADTISAKKYQKDVLRADNIKLIIDRPLAHRTEAEAKAEEEARKGEGWKASRWKEWEVQYAYEAPAIEIEPLVVMFIRRDWYDGTWSYKVVEMEVERETKELFFLKKSHPVSHHSKIEKGKIGQVIIENNGQDYHVIGKMENYHENEIALFNRAEENLRECIESAKQLVIKAETNLDNVQKLKQENGF